MFFSALSSSLLICVITFACCAVGATKPSNSEESDGFQNAMYCQHKSTHGRDYRGRANETATGIPCQRWSDTQPHGHQFTDEGDHNFCRNTFDSQESGYVAKLIYSNALFLCSKFGVGFVFSSSSGFHRAA